MLDKDKVSIIIVSWNGLDHLKKCLPSVFHQNYKKIEVLVVDNGSKDGSINWVKENFPKIKIIANKKNLGFAKANNLGFAASSGKYILFLNNDTVVTKKFITELLKVLKTDDQIGGVQSKILFMDSPTQLDSMGSFITKTGFLYHLGVYQKNSNKFNKVIEIYSAKGACMMFKRSVLEKVKVKGEIFDGKFFAYFEETDLCHRVWLSGSKILFVPGSIIYHKYGATSQRLPKPFVEYNSYKNRISSYIKNLGILQMAKILPVHLIICEGLAWIFLLRRQPKLFVAIHKAFFWNIVNLREILSKRAYIQGKIRNTKDDIIFSRIAANPGLGYFINHLKGWNVTQIYKKNKAR